MKEFINNLINENSKWQEKIDKSQKWVNEGKNADFFKANIQSYQNLINANNEVLVLAHNFIELAEKENFIISKSPSSNSFYAHSENEKIDWGYKPNGSYRFSDHWNFHKNGEIHCEVDEITLQAMCSENNFTSICKMVDGLYRKIL